jgi:hypothetical protein
MPNSPGQWAPWITDPDPPEKPMSPKELASFAKKAAEFMRLNPAKASGQPKPHRNRPSDRAPDKASS